MAKFLKRVTLLSVFGGSAYYAYQHKSEISDFITEKKAKAKEDFADYQNDINKVSNASQKLLGAANRLNEAVEETFPIVDSISDRIDEFSYEIEPNLRKINTKLEKYQ